MNLEKPREYKQCIYSGDRRLKGHLEQILYQFRQPLSFEKTFRKPTKFPTKFLVQDLKIFSNFEIQEMNNQSRFV